MAVARRLPVLALVLLLIAGCGREAAPPEKTAPAYPLEPGLTLTYRGAGREWQVRVYQPITVQGRQLTPVGNTPERIGYVAEAEGWVWEYGRRDPNGEAFWPAPRRVMPARLKAGDRWETTDVGETYLHTVEDVEFIHVAAGSYPTAYRVAVQPQGQSRGEAALLSREWYAAGLGVVLARGPAGQVTVELVRIGREPPGAVTPH